MTLRELGEDEVIRRLVRLMPLPDEASEGPGDDCAKMPPGCDVVLLKTDALVEGIHYEKSAAPERVGWKAVARVVSDFAAMGGRAERFLITVAIDPGTEMAWLEGVYRGMARCMRAHGAVLAGGETSSVPEGNAAVISVAATGRVEEEHRITRTGGAPGDVLFVTGTLGGSIHGKHLDFTPRVREAEWLVTHHKPAAMMDLSDGLGADLPRLAAASGCGFAVDRGRLPVSCGSDTEGAWGDGEDFELLFAIRPNQADALAANWKKAFPDLPLTAIGHLTEKTDEKEASRGWDHFSARR